MTWASILLPEGQKRVCHHNFVHLHAARRSHLAAVKHISINRQTIRLLAVCCFHCQASIASHFVTTASVPQAAIMDHSSGIVGEEAAPTPVVVLATSPYSVPLEMMAAGPGCAIANGLLNGFETTKVKLQLLKTTSSRATSSWTLMNQIRQEQGIWNGLWRPGLSASLTRSLFYGAYRVGLYSYVRDGLASSSENPTIQHRLAAGMATGGLGALLTCPLDVVRTRLQAEAGLFCVHRQIYTTGLRAGQGRRYTGLVQAIASIVQQEGLSQGLYRGASVTIARASLLNGAQLASYDTLKRAFLSSHEEKTESPALHFVCALWSGVIAQTVVMPMDTIKSSLMVGQSWSDIGRRMLQNPTWLYRGYAPACLGQGIIMVLQMPLIEAFRKGLGVGTI